MFSSIIKTLNNGLNLRFTHMPYFWHTLYRSMSVEIYNNYCNQKEFKIIFQLYSIFLIKINLFLLKNRFCWCAVVLIILSQVVTVYSRCSSLEWIWVDNYIPVWRGLSPSLTRTPVTHEVLSISISQTSRSGALQVWQAFLATPFFTICVLSQLREIFYLPVIVVWLTPLVVLFS